MATTVRNTGTHFRYDADTNLWNAKVRVQNRSGSDLTFEEFITSVATFVELLAWLDALLANIATRPDTTVLGL